MLKPSAGLPTAKIPISCFEQYFESINNPNDHFFNPNEDVLYFNERFVKQEFQVMFDELECEISQEEINKAIKQLKGGRSPGPDKMINEFFMYGHTAFSHCLLSIFNKVLSL